MQVKTKKVGISRAMTATLLALAMASAAVAGDPHGQVAVPSGYTNFYGTAHSNALTNSTTAGGTTYLTNTDNENNAGTHVADNDMGGATPPGVWDTDANHPIEFNIDVTGALPTTSASLLIRAFDVDDPAELDIVYVNGYQVGSLTGADNAWSTTVFNVPISHIVSGRNLIQIVVDENPPGTNDNWVVQVASGQLVIDGGAAADATCRAVSLDRSSYDFGDTVNVTVEADTALASQSVLVEANLLDPSGVNVDGASQTSTINGTSDDAFAFAFTLPASGTPGNYKASALIYDSASGLLQATCETGFTVGNALPMYTPVPTLGTWGIGIFLLLLAMAAMLTMSRRRQQERVD